MKKSQTQAYSAFSYKLLRSIIDKNGTDNKNVFVSPARLQAILVLLSNWMPEDYQKLVLEAICCKGMTPLTVNKLFADKHFMVKVKEEWERDSAPSIDLTTLMYLQDGLEINRKGYEAIEKHFSVLLKEVNFRSSTICSEINDAVERASHGLIKEIQVDINELTRALLLDVLYFKAKWRESFNEKNTKNKPFYYNCGKSEVKMMSQTDHFSYKETDTCQSLKLFCLGTESQSYSMWIHLPKKDHSIIDVLDALDAHPSDDYDYREVHLQLPRFEIEQSTSMMDILDSFGLEDVLTSKNVIPNLASGLWLDDIIQKGKISVNETGVEAAVVTYCPMCGCAFFEKPKPIEMNVNHEFIFEIVEENSGLRLFSGIVNKL